MSRRVTGAREAARAIRELGKAIGPPAAEASRYALQPTLRAAKAGAPVDEGKLKRDLTIRRAAKAPKTAPYTVVSAKKGLPTAHRLHLAEFGRPPNADGKGGYAGSRFLTKAYESTKEQVVKRFGERLGSAIEKRAAKLRARTPR